MKEYANIHNGWGWPFRGRTIIRRPCNDPKIRLYAKWVGYPSYAFIIRRVNKRRPIR